MPTAKQSAADGHVMPERLTSEVGNGLLVQVAPSVVERITPVPDAVPTARHPVAEAHATPVRASPRQAPSGTFHVVPSVVDRIAPAPDAVPTATHTVTDAQATALRLVTAGGSVSVVQVAPSLVEMTTPPTPLPTATHEPTAGQVIPVSFDTPGGAVGSDPGRPPVGRRGQEPAARSGADSDAVRRRRTGDAGQPLGSRWHGLGGPGRSPARVGEDHAGLGGAVLPHRVARCGRAGDAVEEVAARAARPAGSTWSRPSCPARRTHRRRSRRRSQALIEVQATPLRSPTSGGSVAECPVRAVGRGQEDPSGRAGPDRVAVAHRGTGHAVEDERPPERHGLCCPGRASVGRVHDGRRAGTGSDGDAVTDRRAGDAEEASHAGRHRLPLSRSTRPWWRGWRRTRRRSTPWCRARDGVEPADARGDGLVDPRHPAVRRGQDGTGPGVGRADRIAVGWSSGTRRRRRPPCRPVAPGRSRSSRCRWWSGWRHRRTCSIRRRRRSTPTGRRCRSRAAARDRWRSPSSRPGRGTSAPTRPTAPVCTAAIITTAVSAAAATDHG